MSRSRLNSIERLMVVRVRRSMLVQPASPRPCASGVLTRRTGKIEAVGEELADLALVRIDIGRGHDVGVLGEISARAL